MTRAEGEPLPPGITGFWGRGAEPPPTVQVQGFQARCRELVRAARGNLLGFDVELEGVARSFHQALVREADGRELLVLCNAHHPWLCAAEAQRDGDGRLAVGFELAFLAPPAWLQPGGGFEVLDLVWLEARLGRADPRLSRLAPVELEQVRYWQPARVGDVVFNLWD